MTAHDLHIGSLVAEVTCHTPTGKVSYSSSVFLENDVAVLMVHGLGGSSNTFESMMPALAEYPVIRIDLPGAGRSAMRAGRPGMDVLTMAVSDMIQACGARQFHLVGHSMGTLICQYLAVQLPERVKSLCLFGPLLCVNGLSLFNSFIHR
jgi:pimeloyl-ACP methyl ester carboxylesterase